MAQQTINDENRGTLRAKLNANFDELYNNTGECNGLANDGIDDNISVPNNIQVNFTTEDFAVELAFTYKNSADTRYLLAKGGSSNQIGYAINTSAGNALLVQLSDGTTLAYTVKTGLIVDKKYHAMFVFKRSTGTLETYINGIKQADKDISARSGSIYTTIYPLTISSYNGTVFNPSFICDIIAVPELTL